MTLDELATKANTLHAEGLAKHIECGEVLIEAQVRCQKDGIPWLGWVEDHLTFGKREAQNYMRLARNTQSVAHSTINTALKSISTPRTAPAEPKAEPTDNVIDLPTTRRPKDFDDYNTEMTPVWEAFMALSKPAKELFTHRFLSRYYNPPKEQAT